MAPSSGCGIAGRATIGKVKDLMNRRGFLSRLAKSVAVAVAAPVIVREVIAAQMPTTFRSNIGIYEQLRQCDTFVLAKQQQKLDLDELFKSLYAIKRHREKNP
jgi:hypothetical protein